VVTVGLKVIVLPVAPVDQVTIPSQLCPVNTTPSPAQIRSFPQVTTGGFGLGLIVIVIVLEPVQLVPVVQVAV
jgi:hypothetical protein